MNYLKLTRDKLSVEAISDLVAHDSCGAISLFAGTTRDNFAEKKVLSLEYEAYEAMALKQMEKICHDIRENWTDVVNIAIYHRLGIVPVREASVVIAISSPHRKSSLDAVAFAIEELKKLVPIWKKEKYEGEESTWKENKESGSCERKKRAKYDFSSCTVEEAQVISKNLIQISADENEINRRIQCFVEKKREEIDLSNILDFTAMKYPTDIHHDDDEKVSTCARTNSVIVKQEDSKCHLKVRRVTNRIGPQISPDYLQTLDKLMAANKTQNINIKQEPPEAEPATIDSIVNQHNQGQLPIGLHERITDVEQHLNLKIVNTKHVYERIKAIENRLLYLESISPEYRHFLDTSLPTNQLQSGFKIEKNEIQMHQRKVYHVNELNAIIEKMKQNDCVKIEKEMGGSTVDY